MILTTYLGALQAVAAAQPTAPTPHAAPGTPASESSVLCNRLRARWTRQYVGAVAIRTGAELAVATAARLSAAHLVMHAERLSATDMFTAAHHGVGHIVISTQRHATLVRSAMARRDQLVLLHTVNTAATCRISGAGFDEDTAVYVLAHPLLRLTGLHADIGCGDGDFVSTPAAIGQMIAEMAEIRDRHNVVLPRVSVGVDSEAAVPDMARHVIDIDAALRDACHTFGYPLPSVIVSSADRALRRGAA
ncbi:hypothetical protein ACQI4L_10410 [Mycolicibacterium litorale]|uniref:hypothetical protein n=1 Tax=Mycolicibacterium litorale TaxID=758802 RepID=UPI003CF55043